MIARSLFPRDLFAELDRLQRDMQQSFEISPSIRGVVRGGFPAINLGHTDDAFEVYAFAPGIDPQQITVEIEKGVLVIAGERKPDAPEPEAKTTSHINERFTGRFRRVVSLPDDVDASAVQARYREGVLRITLPRKQAQQARRITVE